MPTGTTEVNERATSHSHSYDVDVRGNGMTGEAEMHKHKIVRWSVEQEQGHNHYIKEMPLEV